MMMQRFSGLSLSLFLVSLLWSPQAVQGNLETWLEYGALVGGNSSSSDFQAVALDDTTLVVGAHDANTGGEVYVYELDIDEFALITTLTPTDPNTTSSFGISVDIYNDTIVVGASAENAAYVFVREGSGGWSEQQKLTITPSTKFGIAVAIDKDRIVVGDESQGDDGIAVVFDRSGGNWTEGDTLTPSDTDATPFSFGGSVDVDGDAIAVGAAAKNSNTGGAYLFELDGSWSETDIFDGGSAEDYFGTSVSLFGSRLAVGASGADKVYMYTKTFGPDFEELTLEGSDTAPGDSFGSGLKLFGDTLVVGAPDHDTRNGAAYVFRRDRFASGTEEVWDEVVKLAVSSAATGNEFFGRSVAISNDFVVVGENTIPAYVFVQDPETEPPSVAPSQAPSVVPTLFPEEACAEFYRAGCGNNQYMMHKFVRPNDRFGRPMGCKTKCVRRFLLGFNQNRGYQCGSCLTVL